MATQIQKQSSKYGYWIWFALVIIIVLILAWLVTFYIIPLLAIIYFPDLHDEPSSLSEIGDMFNGVSAIFSGLAFAGVIITILLQRDELKAQRDELEATRKEFEYNRLTNIVFKQIERIDTSIQNIEFICDGKYPNNKGIDGIYWINNDFQSNINHTTKLLYKEVDSLYKMYDPLIPAFEISLKLINESSLKDEDKNELKLLFYHNLIPEILVNIEKISEISVESKAHMEDSEQFSNSKKKIKLIHIFNKVERIRKFIETLNPINN